MVNVEQGISTVDITKETQKETGTSMDSTTGADHNPTELRTEVKSPINMTMSRTDNDFKPAVHETELTKTDFAKTDNPTTCYSRAENLPMIGPLNMRMDIVKADSTVLRPEPGQCRAEMEIPRTGPGLVSPEQLTRPEQGLIRPEQGLVGTDGMIRPEAGVIRPDMGPHVIANTTARKEDRESHSGHRSHHNRQRQNHVSTVMLHGVPIVSLHIDGRERLCLAQISTTLLKDFSYNEIHNRRVALGVTCVQCTPVQLEILRRAGAMPVSSRRCGMITKREAERLVKSFLDDTAPPKLPDNFYFDVTHCCGWGGRGQFMPSRYNSSRAKCIKCCYCNMFFSPNKFIFHFHRTADATYNHPDAANFNSWRRHLKLTESEPADDLLHAWEDVKAMFNGGTRKRVMSMACAPSAKVSSSTEEGSKKMRMEQPQQPRPPQYSYPVFPVPNKVMAVKSLPPHPAFMPFLEKPPEMTSPVTSEANKPWPSVPDTYYPPYEMIWAKHLGLTAPESSYVPQVYKKGDENCEEPDDKLRPRLSAFTPVHHRSLSVVTSMSSCSSQSEHGDVSSQCSVSPSHAGHATTYDSRDTDSEDVDVDTIDDDVTDLRHDVNDLRHHDNDSRHDVNDLRQEENNNLKCELTRHTIDNIMERDISCVTTHPFNGPKLAMDDKPEEDNELENSHDEAGQDLSSSPLPPSDLTPTASMSEETRFSATVITSVTSKATKSELLSKNFDGLSKEELQQKLLEILATKRRLEEDCRTIRDTFEEQVKREIAYREEMSKQLQVVRETLCHELDEERKVRYSLQHRLKEAHEALQQFSCKLLPSSRCTECSSYKEVLLPR